MKYKKGYKYQLAEQETFFIPELKSFDYLGRYITLTEGYLTLLSGYAWDGASGPTIDSKSSIRASALHDAIYQLIRMRVLGGQQRIIADKYFYELLKMDGMSGIRAWIWYRSVRRAGGLFIKNPKEILEAP